ncbi:9664_t:CDS:2 [Ambispora leptoticha]|uniref:9664_t:CDS:1 n=1 Tax=Ambispora leptoticha TaxID=144679 RepID=A0A9N8YRV6_9GLOM|nr:9664_t:CDS:2 [Ambispora leptoticha]
MDEEYAALMMQWEKCKQHQPLSSNILQASSQYQFTNPSSFQSRQQQQQLLLQAASYQQQNSSSLPKTLSYHNPGISSLLSIIPQRRPLTSPNIKLSSTLENGEYSSRTIYRTNMTTENKPHFCHLHIQHA